MRKYRNIIKILSLSLLIFSLTLFINSNTGQNYPAEMSGLCLDVLPQAGHCSKVNTPFVHYKGWETDMQTGKDSLSGIAFFTTELAPDIKGYGGPIKILAGLDTKGRLTKIKIIEHAETGSFIKKMDNFITQFEGKRFNDPFQLGKDIDGITKATVSSEAITKALYLSLRKAVPLLEKRHDRSKKTFTHRKIWIVPIIILFFLFIWSFDLSKKITFIFFIVGILLFGVLVTSFNDSPPVSLKETTPAQSSSKSSKDAAALKKMLNEKGIKPHPAKYWKEIH